MRWSKKISCCLVGIALMLCLTGCWDRLEIEERAVVLGIGIDKVPPGTKDEPISHEPDIHPPANEMIRLTVQIAVPGRIPLGPGQGNEGGGGAQNTVWIVDAVGHSIEDAVNNLQESVSPPLFFGHLRIIVVSEEKAREGLRNINDYFRRNPEVRRMNWMFVSAGKAADIMKASPQLERVPTLYLLTTMDQSVKMGKYPNAFLGVFWSALSAKGKEGFLPYAELKDKGNVQITGLAYFRSNKMVGRTEPIEIPLYMGIAGISVAGGQTYVKVPGTQEYVTWNSRTRQSQINVSIENGKPMVSIDIAIEGNLIGKSEDVIAISDEVIAQIEQVLAAQSRKGYLDLIAKTQRHRSDIFGFGEYFRAKKPAYWNAHVTSDEDWQNIYPTVSVDVMVKMHVRRIGMKAN